MWLILTYNDKMVMILLLKPLIDDMPAKVLLNKKNKDN